MINGIEVGGLYRCQASYSVQGITEYYPPGFHILVTSIETTSLPGVFEERFRIHFLSGQREDHMVTTLKTWEILWELISPPS